MQNLNMLMKIPSTLDVVRDKIQGYVSKHDDLGVRTSKAEDWRGDVKWLHDLRHGYFHFSAKIKLGHTPRIEHGERIREVHRG